MATILHQWLLIAYTAMIHPFYVSMTDINYNDKNKSLEISVRIFTDDFEQTLRKSHQDKIDILHPANQELMNKYVSAYIQQHLQLKVNDKPVQLNFVGYEQQSESIWSYFEVQQVAQVNKLAIMNDLLHEYNNNQINMMHVKVKEAEKSNKLNYPENTAVFTF